MSTIDFKQNSENLMEINGLMHNTFAMMHDRPILLKADGSLAFEDIPKFNHLGLNQWQDIVEISANYHGTLLLGLRKNGTIIAAGEREIPPRYSRDLRTIPSLARGEKNAVSISAGGFHDVVLHDDGTVSTRFLPLQQDEYRLGATQYWSDIVQIATGHLCTVGLRSDGQIEFAGKKSCRENECETWRDVVQIAARQKAIVGLEADGTVDFAGELMSMKGPDVKQELERWRNIAAIATDGSFVYGLKNDFTVLCVGKCGVRNYAGGAEAQLDLDGWGRVIALSCETIPHAIRLDGSIVTAIPGRGTMDTSLRMFGNAEDYFNTRRAAQVDNIELINQIRVLEERRYRRLCQHCGGNFNGLFKKICSNCGKPKDY